MEALNSFTPLQRFWRLLRPDRKEIIRLYIFAIFNGLINLSLPLGIQAIVNIIQGGEVSASWILLVSIVIAGILFTGILQIFQMTITESIQQNIFTRGAFELAYRLPRISFESIYGKHMPELVNRYFDISNIQKGYSKILLDFSTATLQIFFGLVLLSLYHPFFIFFSFVLTLIVFAIIRFTGPRGLKTSLEESKYKYKVAYWLEEVGRTMFTFKLAGSTDLPMKKADRSVQNYLTERKKHFHILITQYALMVGFKVVVAAGLLITGSLLVIDQQLNLGQFVAAEIIILLVINAVEKLILSMDNIYDVLTALEKVGNLTDLPLEKDNGQRISELVDNGGLDVKLNDLSYSFPGSKSRILKELNLHISSGEKICISGSNGSGKSTLLHLIAGFYNKYEGTISYNGIPLGNLYLEDLHTFMGDSLAQETIFEGTLLENITMGKSTVSISDVKWAAEHSQLQGYIEKLPQGFETELSPGGQRLPRSVVSKIILARSIACKPKLLLLEDNFYHISDEDREKIYGFITDEKNSWTLIAISNDPLLAQKCGKVVILNNGRVEKAGPFKDMRNYSFWFNQNKYA